MLVVCLEGALVQRKVGMVVKTNFIGCESVYEVF